MIRNLLLVIVCWCSLASSATHIVGGDLHYEHLGGDQYEIILKIYRDCQFGISGFDNPASIGVFNQANQLVLNVEIDLNDAIITNLPIGINDPCLAPPAGICVEEGVYTTTVTIPYEPGGFTLTYQRCCRNTTLVNCESNDDIGITLTTQIPDKEVFGDNSSPDFINFPPIAICINEPFVFDHSATDSDGDVLVYEFCNPLLTNVPGNYINPPGAPDYPLLQFYPEYNFGYPIDADPAFTINEDSGLLQGTPISMGQYVFGICVKEFRNGELLSTTNRDFQFNIVACSQTTAANIEEEEPCQGLEIDFDNTSNNAEIYWWDFGDTSLESDTSSLFEPMYMFGDTGTYIVTLIANPGFQCADTSYITVYAYEPIDAGIVILDDFCENGIRYFQFGSLEQYTSNADFNWSFGAGGDPGTSTDFDPDIIAYDGPGTYTIVFQVEDHNCVATAFEDIEISPLPLAGISEQSEFCDGLSIDFTNLSQFATEYLWDFGEPGNGDQSTEENPSFTYDDYGIYTVTLTADPDSDCADDATIEVVILSPDPIEMSYLIHAPSPCDGSLLISLQWLGQGADLISWDMGDGTVIEGSPAEYIYEEFGEYTVTILAEQFLCDFEESDEHVIFYDLSVIDLPILIPNVFSPNGDVHNERYRIFYLGETEDLFPPGRSIFSYVDNYSMKIFDRWGVLMFDSESDGSNWDGSYKGEPVSEGTYYYIITYRRLCLDPEVINEAGSLEVLRRE